jgi:5-methylcytosine-specific restriction endonuclease McrA
MDYEEYLLSDQWREKAQAAKQRERWECTLCRSTRSLEVHHRTYDRLGHENIEDLVVLCWRCHRKHHGTFEHLIDRQRRYERLMPFSYTFPKGDELN